MTDLNIDVGTRPNELGINLGVGTVMGVSPTAKVERVEDGALVTVTDSSGTTTAMLHDATGIASAADALMGDPSESTWATRTSTGSGMARVESVQGAAEVQDGELVPVRIAGIRSTDAQGGELDSVEWTAQTLRAAGSVRDELTAGELVTRVGNATVNSVAKDTGNAFAVYGDNVRFTVRFPNQKTVSVGERTNATFAQFACSTLPFNNPAIGAWTACLYNDFAFVVLPKSELTAQTVAGVNAWLREHPIEANYLLATPTTTPISPALPMTYRVEQGGTESIIVPDGEVSAAPVITVAEGESAADVVMDALACIATPDGPVATANHAVNTYLTMHGKLYKVTRAIASGETIASGINVTETTVMNELLALAN